MLFLVRHGRAAAGIEDHDPGLDDVGRFQAEAAARALAGCGATRLVVSPLKRTRETARPIAKLLDLPEEIRVEVSEVFEPELSTEDRRTMLGSLLSGRWSEQSGALQAWRKRVIETLRSLASDDVVVVSHFVAIGAAIGAALGDDRVCPAPLPNASISRLRLEGDKLAVVAAGDVSHLPPDRVTLSTTALLGPKL
jgi:broad specificity phosphatase PhoE